eukprot:7692208-Lingulodinium_polyedra.AAC.1
MAKSMMQALASKYRGPMDRVVQFGGAWALNTICSGIDACALSVEACFNVFRSILGKNLELQH